MELFLSGPSFRYNVKTCAGCFSLTALSKWSNGKNPPRLSLGKALGLGQS